MSAVVTGVTLSGLATGTSTNLLVRGLVLKVTFSVAGQFLLAVRQCSIQCVASLAASVRWDVNWVIVLCLQTRECALVCMYACGQYWWWWCVGGGGGGLVIWAVYSINWLLECLCRLQYCKYMYSHNYDLSLIIVPHLAAWLPGWIDCRFFLPTLPVQVVHVLDFKHSNRIVEREGQMVVVLVVGSYCSEGWLVFCKASALLSRLFLCATGKGKA